MNTKKVSAAVKIRRINRSKRTIFYNFDFGENEVAIPKLEIY